MRSKTSQAGILLSLVLVLLLSAGCLSSVKEIQQGFSDKLVQMLSEDYDLVIPESAVLEEGRFNKPFRDADMEIHFTIPTEDFLSIFGENWSKSVEKENEDGPPTQTWLHGIADPDSKKKDGWLEATEADGEMRVLFVGDHPDARGIK